MDNFSILQIIRIFAVHFAGVAKLVDALDLGSSGQPWGFESLHPHKFKC